MSHGEWSLVRSHRLGTAIFRPDVIPLNSHGSSSQNFRRSKKKKNHIPDKLIISFCLSVCFVCHSMPEEGTHSPKASIICLAPAEQKDQMRYYVENWTRHKIFLVEHKKQTKAASAAAAPDQMLFASLSFEIGDPAFFAGDREKKKQWKISRWIMMAVLYIFLVAATTTKLKQQREREP